MALPLLATVGTFPLLSSLLCLLSTSFTKTSPSTPPLLSPSRPIIVAHIFDVSAELSVCPVTLSSAHELGSVLLAVANDFLHSPEKAGEQTFSFFLSGWLESFSRTVLIIFTSSVEPLSFLLLFL
jgi:hypothetical protein